MAERSPRRRGLAATFRFALAGLAVAWRTQRNLRIHGAIAVAVVVAGLAAGLPAWAWTGLVLAIALVLAAELFNTALEAVVDLVSPGEHPLARVAKDVAAGAVLVTAAGAVAVGAVVALWVVRRALGHAGGMV